MVLACLATAVVIPLSLRHSLYGMGWFIHSSRTSNDLQQTDQPLQLNVATMAALGATPNTGVIPPNPT